MRRREFITLLGGAAAVAARRARAAAGPAPDNRILQHRFAAIWNERPAAVPAGDWTNSDGSSAAT